MLRMKAAWGNLNRVRIGRWKVEPGGEANKPTPAEVVRWCVETLHGHFFHSPGFEVFYFDNHQSAVYFKLRWFHELYSL